VAEEIVGRGGSAIGLTCDISSSDSVNDAVAACVAQFAQVTLCNHNAAWTSFSHDTNAETIDLAMWERVINTNTTGGLRLVQALVPHFRQAGRGAFVFITSGSAAIGENARVAYGTSKAALEQLMRHVATTYGRDNIRCNAVAPGMILTDTAAVAISEESLLQLAAENPLRRLGTGHDIATVVAFLLSSDAAYVNGQILRVDGGLMIAPRLGPLAGRASEQTS
jgi:NAD(P)-dependent dehydrogenase (short-subunit alcohol dehydrogenase family)